eukprot:6197106-Pleurochrysis_carterae.AAC.2
MAPARTGHPRTCSFGSAGGTSFHRAAVDKLHWPHPSLYGKCCVRSRFTAWTDQRTGSKGAHVVVAACARVQDRDAARRSAGRSSVLANMLLCRFAVVNMADSLSRMHHALTTACTASCV